MFIKFNEKKVIFYFFILLGTLNIYTQTCANQGVLDYQDFDCDGIVNSIDIDDDNDGVLDVTELNCGKSRAKTAIDKTVHTTGLQYLEGTFIKGNATADYNIDFQDLSGTLRDDNIYDYYKGLHYVIDDTYQGDYKAVITITPKGKTMVNKFIWGPNLLGNKDSENVNSKQTITLNWNTSNLVTVYDPNDELDINGNTSTTDIDGVSITSGDTIFQKSDNTAARQPTWYVEFESNFSSEPFILTVNHKAPRRGDLRNEGFSLVADICYQENIDGDGELNHLDLDSDNDGCSDAQESSAALYAISTANYMFDFISPTNDANMNGLADTVEEGISGNINYISTYYRAISDQLKGCTDFDGDTIPNVVDIDDDNDGVLDTQEYIVKEGCFSCEYNEEYQYVLWIDAPWTGIIIRTEPIEGIASIGGETVNVTLTAANTLHGKDGPFQTDDFCPPPPSNDSNFSISSNNVGLHTIAFDKPILNPRLMVSSMNTGMTFPHDVIVIQNNNVTIGDYIEGCECDATIIFPGIYKEISWQGGGDEYRMSISVVIENILPSGTNTYIDNNPTAGKCIYAYIDKHTDQDDIPNHLDLDSDNDGCSDAQETSAAPYDITTTNYIFDFVSPTNDANMNGLADTVEEGTSGDINYTSTYYRAISNQLKGCTDSDGDTIPDVIDIDDDNDGVLDTQEMVSCNLFLGSSLSSPGYLKNGHSAPKPWTNINSPDTNNDEFPSLNGSYNPINYTGPSEDGGTWVTMHNNLNSEEGIEQTLTGLTEGKEYIIGWEEANFGGKYGSNIYNGDSFVEVFINGSRIGYSNSVSGVVPFPVGTDWKKSEISFIATSTSHTIAFRSASKTSVTALGGSNGTNLKIGLVHIDGITIKESECTGFLNTDNDEYPNHLDLDSDGDQCSDAFETGATTDGTSSAFKYEFVSPTNDANNNGLADTVEEGLTGNVNYSPTYYVAISENMKSCLDTDNDNINNLSDLDDDNDGILDSKELNCGIAIAATTTENTQTAIDQQHFEGVFTNGEATLNYSVDFEYLANALSPTLIYDGNSGVHYIVNDTRSGANNQANYRSILSLMPQENTVINEFMWGPDLIGNTNASNLNDVQTIILRWTPIIKATIYDPDNQLDINQTVDDTDTDGVEIVSGDQIYQRAAFGSASPPTWSVAFSGMHLSEDFKLTTEHIGMISPRSDLRREGFSFVSDICYLRDTDQDTIPNHLDLDSDGDDCPDAIEAGVSGDLINGNIINGDGTTNITTNTANAVAQAPYGNNGLANNLEEGNDTDTATTTYTSTYDAYALDKSINLCKDTDDDKIPDLVDIDDDNDGVLDIEEQEECNLIKNGSFSNSDGLAVQGSVPEHWETTFATPDTNNNTVPVVFDKQYRPIEYTGESPDGGTWVGMHNYSKTGEGVKQTVTGLTIGTQYTLSWQEANFGATGVAKMNGDIYVDIYLDYETPEEKLIGTSNKFNGKIFFPVGTDWKVSTINFVATATSHSIAIMAGKRTVIYNLGGFMGSGTQTNGHVVVDGVYLEETNCTGDIDTDKDKIPNRLDLDSDGDGCPDAIEAGVSGVLINGDIVNIDGTTEKANAVAQAPYGDNGLANDLEDNNDTDTATTTAAYTSTYDSYALDKTTNVCGVAMITQVYQTATERWVEIKNIDPDNSVAPNAMSLVLYKDTDAPTGDPTAIYTNSAEIPPGQTFIFSSGTVTNIASGITAATNEAITNFAGANDVIGLSRASNAKVWSSRFDVIRGIKDNTSYVRKDEVLKANSAYTDSEWVAFIDDAIITYSDPLDDTVERHPHAPLLSEVTATINAEANVRAGIHTVHPTIRESDGWSNGYPDRSRHVIIDSDYNHSTARLSARKLTINANKVLSVTNNLLVVSDAITLDGEIRLISDDDTNKAQLVQTHTGASLNTGGGKLLVDQNSPTESKYRYNYMSSPVNTIGENTYSIASVLKDGTESLNSTGGIDLEIAKKINFVESDDGETKEPISISKRWLYAFPSKEGAYSNWKHMGDDGEIPQTDGFTIKGPGRAQNYTFVGAPKNGDLTSSIGEGEMYLLGNPYSSAMSVKKFIEDNPATTGELYFWEHVGEENLGYAGHNYGGYIGGYASRTIAIGLSAKDVTSNNRTDDNIPSVGGESKIQRTRSLYSYWTGFCCCWRSWRWPYCF